MSAIMLNYTHDPTAVVANITGGPGQFSDQMEMIHPPKQGRDIKNNENVFNNKDDDYQHNSDEEWNEDDHETPDESQNEDDLFEEEVQKEE